MYKFIQFVSFCFLLTLFSCSPSEFQTSSKFNEEGKITINVSGKKYIATDPYFIKVDLVGLDTTITSELEVMMDDYKDGDVNFEWKNQYNCNVIFTQKDQTKLKVPVQIYGLK